MNDKEVTTIDTSVPPFSEHLLSAVQGLRAALIELLASVDADASKPQDVARRFGINKNLTWKISKIVGAADLYSAVPNIPGPPGMRILLRTFEKAGAPAHLLEETRDAANQFNHVVKVHTGDRTTLEIMISDLLPISAQGERNEQSRKLAFQGNSGTWGVRARVQLSLNILAPNDEQPDMADLVQVGGLAGFRRLRPDARWLLYRRERWSDDDPHPARDIEESLDPDYPVSKGVPLIGPFCTKPIPTLDVIDAEGEVQYELPQGPVGNSEACTCIFGHVARRVGPVFADREDEYIEIGSNLITPAEYLLFDLLVHRDFEWAHNPEMIVYSRMDGGALHRLSRRTRNELPMTEPVHDLGWGATSLATSLMPRYSKLTQYAFDRMGWDSNDFRAFRFKVSYPPIPTAPLFRIKQTVQSQAALSKS